MALRCTPTLLALLAIALILAPAAHSHTYGRGDTGVVNVSRTPGFSEGEEPLSVNPRNPRQLPTVANVFQPNAPPPLDRLFGGGGFQDTRVYSSRDGGRHWRTRKLDQGGLGRVPNPLPEQLGFAPEFSDAFNIVNTDAGSAWDRRGNAYFESGDIHGIHHGGGRAGDSVALDQCGEDLVPAAGLPGGQRCGGAQRA